MIDKTWRFVLVDRRSVQEIKGKLDAQFVNSPASFSKSGQLEWFRRFAYCDFGQLTDDEKAVLYAEARGWLGRVGSIDSLASLPDVAVEDLSQIEKWQALFSRYFEMILGVLEGKDSPPLSSNALRKPPPNVSLDFFRGHFWGVKNYFELLPEPISVNHHASPYLMMVEKPGAKKRLEFRTLVAPSKGHEFSYLLFEFLKALDGLRVTSCWRCEQCNRWFFNLSERVKRFCSNRCAAAKGMRVYRQKLKAKDPKKYQAELVENRKRARKSRVNKMATKYKKYRRIKETEGM